MIRRILLMGVLFPWLICAGLAAEVIKAEVIAPREALDLATQLANTPNFALDRVVAVKFATQSQGELEVVSLVPTVIRPTVFNGPALTVISFSQDRTKLTLVTGNESEGWRIEIPVLKLKDSNLVLEIPIVGRNGVIGGDELKVINYNSLP